MTQHSVSVQKNPINAQIMITKYFYLLLFSFENFIEDFFLLPPLRIYGFEKLQMKICDPKYY